MDYSQMTLPFPRRSHRQVRNHDLLGRTYFDELAKVTVVGLCKDQKYVMVRRRPGKTSPMLAWLIRLIFEQEESRRKFRGNQPTNFKDYPILFPYPGSDEVTSA
jgi:hypothetical protein